MSIYFFTIMVVEFGIGFKILGVGWAAGRASEKTGQGLLSARHSQFQTAAKHRKAQCKSSRTLAIFSESVNHVHQKLSKIQGDADCYAELQLRSL